MIRGLDNVYYFVSDVKAALQFYNGILGLESLDQDEHWASLSLNGVRLGLHLGNPKGSADELAYRTGATDELAYRSGATVTLSVDDLDLAYDLYKSKGVHFLGPISRNPWGSHVSLNDLDGNILDLRQAPTNIKDWNKQ